MRLSIAPHLYRLWENQELNQKNLSKLGTQELARIMEGSAAPAKTDQKAHMKRRWAMQLRALPNTLKVIKELVETEMHPSRLDANVFAFRGYLFDRFADSGLRPWSKVEGSFSGIQLQQVSAIDPTTWIKVAKLAEGIEIPIDAYSNNSGETLRAISPQATRFMGKTTEEAEYHEKGLREQRAQGKAVIFCVNSWCREENRHAGALGNSAKNISGRTLEEEKNFTSYPGLSGLNVKDAFFHLFSRNDTEWHAGSAYFLLGAHARDQLGQWIAHVRQDELKHQSIFGGLYKYIFGDTYNKRLFEMVKKGIAELREKGGEQSMYGDVFKTEPITAIETIYIHYLYEKQIRKFFSSLPLKSLRKIYETEILLEKLGAVPMSAEKEAALKELTERETNFRKTLARWPKAQREAYERLEAFEKRFSLNLEDLIKKGFNSFKGAEDFGSAGHSAVLSKINDLTVQSVSEYGFGFLTKDQLGLLKKSLSETLRDYQIMNNSWVRQNGLTVYLKDARTGFELVRDEAYNKVPRVVFPSIALPPEPAISTSVLEMKNLTPSTGLIRITKPQGYQFQPGEATKVTLKTADGKEVAHYLSIANSPSRNYLEFAVRTSPSEFKTAFFSLKSQNEVQVAPARGALKFNPQLPAVMIAGGIGITPFRSIIQTVVDQNLQTPLHLIYANRNANEIAFKSEFDQLASVSKQFRVDYLVSEATPGFNGIVGQLNKETLQALIQSQSNQAIYYIVGPPMMVMGVQKTLLDLGIPIERISIERFAGYKD